MAFEHFPYANFHDLNLDWMIQQFQQWAVEWAAVKKAYEDFNADLSDIDSQLSALRNDVIDLNSNVENIENRIAVINMRITSVEQSINELRETTTAALNDLDTRVSTIEEYAVYNMYSPFTGELVPITEIITQLSYFHLADALTAEEYDALELTAAAYDLKELTAIQYDSSGKTLLP